MDSMPFNLGGVKNLFYLIILPPESLICDEIERNNLKYFNVSGSQITKVGAELFYFFTYRSNKFWVQINIPADEMERYTSDLSHLPEMFQFELIIQPNLWIWHMGLCLVF